MTRPGRCVRAALLVLVAASVAGCTVGSRPSPGDLPALEVVRRAEQQGRFEAYLTGSMPTRAELGLVSGATLVSLEPDDPDDTIRAEFTLVGDRRFVVSSSSVLVSTPFLSVTSARSPVRVDDALLPPNSIEATQDVASSAEVRDLLRQYADLLALDTDDIDLWYAGAPAGPGPDVILDKHYFASASPVGYVDVEVGVYIDRTSEYVTWTLSWRPPVPGHAYDSNGVPRPTSS